MTFLPVTRRSIIAGASAVAALTALSPRTVLAAHNVGATAEAAAIWGLPLVETGRYFDLAKKAGFGVNRFYLNSRLATPALKAPGPNIDTIYGFAWLDLSKEPLVLDVPDTNDRYYSIQLIDAYENTFAYVGRRETGTKAGTFVIAAPGWKSEAPAGAKVISAPTALVLALTRTLVRGPTDEPVAARLQLQYTLSPLSTYPAGRQGGIVHDNALNILPFLDLKDIGASFFDELDHLVRLYPPVGPEAETFAHFKSLKLGTPGFAAHHPDPAVLEAAYNRAFKRIVADNTSDIVNGWRVDYQIRKFIKNPLDRAATNRFGPGAHIAQEALYFAAVTDAQGAPLDGKNHYSLTFPAGQLPPVDGFWSLILYGPDYFLVDNPLNRYGINDRTPGLVYGADGSLTLTVQHDKPANTANWLPAPEGKFQLLFRTYQPRPALLDKSYKVPPLQRS